MTLVAATVPFVAHAESDPRHVGELHQAISPVAMILTGGEILQLGADIEFAVDFVFTVEDEDIALHILLSIFGGSILHARILELVHIHEGHLEGRGELLLNLEIEIEIIGLSPSEEGGGRTVSSPEIAVHPFRILPIFERANIA